MTPSEAFPSGRFEGGALDALDMAIRAGYERLTTNALALVPDALKNAELPYVWHETRADALAKERRGFHVMKASPCHVLVDHAARIYQMLFSRQRDLFVEEMEWMPVAVGHGTGALEGGRLTHEVSHLRFTYESLGGSPIEAFDEPVLYIRAPLNFGHWVLDFMTTLLLATNAFPALASLPLALAQLPEDQRRLLDAMGYGADRLRILTPAPGEKRLYRMACAWVPSSGRLPLGFDLVREKMAGLQGLPPHRGSRRLFLSRRHFHPRHRIANEDEIEALLKERGFETLYPETLDPLDLLSRVREADILVLPFGAGNGNMAMAPKRCQMIMLAPEFLSADRFDSRLLRVQRSYLLPFFDRIHFVAGKPETRDGETLAKDGSLYWSLSALDAPHSYNPKAVDQALMNAEKLLAWSRI
ncbi:MAG: glycosyltransferase family 61 protein [Rhodospirillales bacterium]|nr:glycosyltransferase family 61 protein [Rhodospirillales bacterium]